MGTALKRNEPMGALWEIFAATIGSWFGVKAAKIFSTDHRNDPVYKKKLQDLIERNQGFEKKQ
jgi:hypothetical protein